MSLDDDPFLMEQSYRLRYQVYCVERQFLPLEDYPDQLESDRFDRHSIHVGAVDRDGILAATARIVKPNSAGLPLFGHCTLFPLPNALEDESNLVVEVSRVSISRHYARRREDASMVVALPPGSDPSLAATVVSERRQHSGEPFLTLLRAIHHAAKRLHATHLIGATDAALHRWLVHHGFPYRLAGPEVDYYGPVAPYILSMAELDQVILGGTFASLEGFPVDLGPELRPGPDEGSADIRRARPANWVIAPDRPASD
jgi:N-acyl amino acid synthase of PEP-CTERM/exosortase system